MGSGWQWDLRNSGALGGEESVPLIPISALQRAANFQEPCYPLRYPQAKLSVVAVLKNRRFV